MKEPDFELQPCIFCTIGYNCFVAGYKTLAATRRKLSIIPRDTGSTSDRLTQVNQPTQISE
jgi:hypothetical protein